MRYFQNPKSLLIFLGLVIAISTCGCSSYNDDASPYPIWQWAIPNKTMPTTIFDYPNAAARNRQPHASSSQQFFRQEWPITSAPTGYVTTGVIAGYREYTSDYQRIGSNNLPHQYYNRRTQTFRMERKYR